MSRILIVGGGVIGLTAALRLCREGYRVTLIERDKLGIHASSKNAGLIVPSMYNPYPLAMDIMEIIKNILSRTSPIKVSIKELGCKNLYLILKSRRKLLKRLDWRLLRRMGKIALDEIKDIIKDMDEVEFCEGKILEIYSEPKYLEHSKAYVRDVKIDGLHIEIIGRNELLEMEPALTTNIVGGIKYVSDASINPVKYIEELVGLLSNSRVEIIENEEITSFREDNDRVEVLSNKGAKYVCDILVIATGPWTRQLLHNIGIDLPIFPARGYIIRYPSSAIGGLGHQIMIEELKIVLNPYRDGLTIGGIMDFVGFNNNIPYKRIENMLREIPKYISEFKMEAYTSIEIGFRPCTPDEIPIIGTLPPFKNIIVASGHCRFGLTFSGLTAYHISRLISGEGVDGEVEIFSPIRLLH